MRVINTSKYSTDRIKELLSFVTCGIRDRGVEVQISNSRKRPSGVAYSCAHGQRKYKVYKVSRRLVVLRLPLTKYFPQKTYTEVRKIQKLWPRGILLDTWEDCLIWLAAHEFKHIKQFRKAEKLGEGGKGEFDAENFSMLSLNEWRANTGRQPIPSTKYTNPFCCR